MAEEERTMTRQYPMRPMAGVGATIFRGDQVLIVQRGSEPAYGQWSLPGGLVEVGEPLHQAIRREVKEEVNLEVTVVDVVAVLDRVLKDGAGEIEYHYILIDFLCHGDVGQPVPGSDVLDCRFVALADLHRYTITSGTLTVIQKAMSMLQGKHITIYDRGL